RRRRTPRPSPHAAPRRGRAPHAVACPDRMTGRHDHHVRGGPVRARPSKLGMAAGDRIRRGWDPAGRLATIYAGGRRARRFYAFGANSSICFPWSTLLGDDRIAIGADTMVGPYSTLSAGLPLQPPNPAWAGPTLTIGDRCLIGRGATITAHLDVV